VSLLAAPTAGILPSPMGGNCSWDPQVLEHLEMDQIRQNQVDKKTAERRFFLHEHFCNVFIEHWGEFGARNPLHL
jgi:hypothetical protein